MSRDLMTPATFHNGPDLRATVFSPTPPYSHSSSVTTPDSWNSSPTLPSLPHPEHVYTTSVTLSSPSPSSAARHNGLAPVAVVGVGLPAASDRVPFKAVRPPHDPLLSSLDDKVTKALEPVALVRQHLTAANAALSNYLTHSTALCSALHILSQSATLQQYLQYHHSALHALTVASSFYSIDVLYPLTDWLDDASQLSIELGHTQQLRHQLSAATDELDNLFVMKAEDAVPPSVDELIGDRKDKVEKLSGLYAGQVEGVERSVRKVLEGRERMVEMVGRNWREWEWKVMRRWTKLAEVLGKADGEVDKEEDEEEEEEEDEKDEDEQQDANDVDDAAESTGYSQLLSPEISTHTRSLARKVDPDDEHEEEWQTALQHSDSEVDEVEDDEDDADDSVLSPTSASSTSSGMRSPPFSPSATTFVPQPPPNFPYKPPASPSVALTPLPWRPLPADGLAQSVWLSLFGSAYKWDEGRDELVCQFEVRAGEGKEEVERVFRRRKRRSRRDVSGVDEETEALVERRPAQLVRLLSERREEEVEAVMRRVGLSAQDVAAAILAVDLDKLTADKVSLLISILPTDTELANLLGSLSSSSTSSSALLSSLSPASLLLTSLIAPLRPSLITRLHCLHHYYQLPTIASSSLSSLALLHQSASQLRESTLFHHTLAAILELFNYLHPKQVAYAFDIRLLSSLSNLTASSASPSFLAFLVSHLASHHPQLLSFPASLPSLHRAAQVSASTLHSQLSQLQSHVADFRTMLDALGTSTDPDDRTGRQRWLQLFDQLLDSQDKFEKRKAATAAKCDEVCNFLCYTQPPSEQPSPSPLPTKADIFALLQLLDTFVTEFNTARSKEERRRTRRERFRVNVKEEKIKQAMEVEEKRRQRQQQSAAAAGRQRTSKVVSPRAGNMTIFSELHERHSPPAIERMERNPSISPRPPDPQQLSGSDRRTSTSSESNPARRERTPVFSIRSGASPAGATSPQSASPAQQSSPQLSTAASRREFSSVVSSGRASVSGRGSVTDNGADVQTVVYRDDDDENAQHTPIAGVKVSRLPFQSHFTYTP